MAKKKYLILAKCFDKRGRLISSAYNDYNKTHPRMKKLAEQVNSEHRQYLHAEVRAILRAKGKKIHRLVVERYAADGSPADARPCPVCWEAIAEAGITLVEWTKTGV